VGVGVEAYAKAVGREKDVRQVRREVDAAEIADAIQIGNIADLVPYTIHLAEMHSAPRWLWRSLVSRLVSEGALALVVT